MSEIFEPYHQAKELVERAQKALRDGGMVRVSVVDLSDPVYVQEIKHERWVTELLAMTGETFLIPHGMIAAIIMDTVRD